MAVNLVRRKLIGLPYFVCAVLDLHCRAHQFTDKELHRFMYRLGKAGVDYIRLFPFWGEEVTPFMKKGKKYDLDLPKPQYWNNLRRVCETAAEWKISIYFDLFDHCGTKQGRDWSNRDWNCWYNNRQGVKDGIYGTDIISLRNYMLWIKRVWDVVGKRGYFIKKDGSRRKLRPNLYGLGNELDSRQAWDTKDGRDDWGIKWGYGLAHYLWRLGYRKEILWSAEKETSHVLRACLDKGDPLVRKIRPECPWGKKDTVAQHHGWISRLDPDSVTDIVTNTNVRKIGYSDDGVNYKWGGDGICVEVDGKTKYCSADTRSVIRLCRYIHENLNRGYQFHHIEQLPRSVSEVEHSVSDLKQHRDVNIYKRIAKQVWGVDITRKYPRWLLKRHGIKE